MAQVIFCGEGLIEHHADVNGVAVPPGISGDGVAAPLAASLINTNLSKISGETSVKIKMLTAAGRDNNGCLIENFCAENDIDTSSFALIAGSKTASWEFLKDPDPLKKPVNTYYDRQSENSPIDRLFRYTGREVARCLHEINHDTIFAISGIAASRPFGAETFANMMRVLDEAKHRGAHIIVDPNTRLKLFQSDVDPDGDPALAYDRLSALFSRADTVLLSYPDDIYPTGVEIFPWGTAAEARDNLFEFGAHQVVVKEGHKGSTLYVKEGATFNVPTVNVEDPNPSGAGDAFAGGFAVALAHGFLFEEAVGIATCTARQKVLCPKGALLTPELVPDADSLQRAAGTARQWRPSYKPN